MYVYSIRTCMTARHGTAQHGTKQMSSLSCGEHIQHRFRLIVDLAGRVLGGQARRNLVTRETTVLDRTGLDELETGGLEQIRLGSARFG